MGLRTAVGTLGLAGALLALGLVLAPSSLRSIRPIALTIAALSTESPRALLIGIGILAGLGSIVLARAASGARHRADEPLVERPPEDVHSETPSRPGSEFDRLIDDRSTVRETLRTTAVEILVQQARMDRADARTAVERGTWTDDRVAASFLGTPNQSLAARLRHWLDPERERERRIRRCVSAIEHLEGPE